MKEHFPKSHLISEILNKNAALHQYRKLSYINTTNTAAVTTSHNQNVLNPRIENFDGNGGNKQNCPWHNNCLTTRIILEANVANDKDNDEKIYFGWCETPSKERYNNHSKSFRNQASNRETELYSKYTQNGTLNVFGFWKKAIKHLPPLSEEILNKLVQNRNIIVANYV